jgi:hypothetical protein
MIQFNINRFGKLARWSLTNDKKYYTRSFLQVFAMLMLVFLSFTGIIIRMSNVAPNYQACGVVVIMMFAINIIIGPSLMFYSMTGKHDRQSLLMLPASNFEKYLMRYSSWILLLPLYAIAFLSADLIQYLVHVIMGHDFAMFVTSKLLDYIHVMKAIPLSKSNWLDIAIFLFWLHSLYALGGTFFRSRKFNWVLTTIVFIAFCIVCMWSFDTDIKSKPQTWTHGVMEALYFVWALVNFWLSYKLFCRTQVIGKFVNL